MSVTGSSSSGAPVPAGAPGDRRMVTAVHVPVCIHVSVAVHVRAIHVALHVGITVHVRLVMGMMALLRPAAAPW